MQLKAILITVFLHVVFCPGCYGLVNYPEISDQERFRYVCSGDDSNGYCSNFGERIGIKTCFYDEELKEFKSCWKICHNVPNIDRCRLACPDYLTLYCTEGSYISDENGSTDNWRKILGFALSIIVIVGIVVAYRNRSFLRGCCRKEDDPETPGKGFESLEEVDVQEPPTYEQVMNGGTAGDYKPDCDSKVFNGEVQPEIL